MSLGYSKKLMEHFQNPRNQGEIVNASGIGQVGNPVCLVAKSTIYFNGQADNIENFRYSQLLTHKGRYCKINKRYKRNYQGDIIEIKNKMGATQLTPEHLILAIKKPDDHYYRLTRNKKELSKSAAFWHASDLDSGDIVLYPILNKIQDLKEIAVPIKKYFYDFRSVEIPKKIKINNEFLRLAGYYLSEGSLKDEICRTHLCFTFNINEQKYINDIIYLIRRIFKLNPIVKRVPARSTAHILVNNVHLTRWFKKLFGKGAANKLIPDFMMFLPSVKQKWLLLGLWRGDGYIDPKIGRTIYATISKQLAYQIRILLLRQKITFSFYNEPAREVNGVKHKKVYRIHIGQKESVKKLEKILGQQFSLMRPTAADSWFDSKYLYLPITKTKITKYHGLVYNFEVSKDHSYVTSSVVAHNCGDVMKIYIKVIPAAAGKKSDDDTIADIKFETLGCGAAIACSSMLTELAKGKKIKDAVAISRQDIADALGGVPSPKMHCSVLAADGLKEAVKNYLNK